MKRETIFRIERGERRILDYELVLLIKILELDNNEAENQIYQHFQDIHNQKTINNAWHPIGDYALAGFSK